MIEHNKWFNLEHNGESYRIKYLDHGFSYSTFRIDKKIKKIRLKYFIFGPEVEYESYLILTRDSRDEDLGFPITRRRFYEVEFTRNKVKDIIYIIETRGTHQEYI